MHAIFDFNMIMSFKPLSFINNSSASNPDWVLLFLTETGLQNRLDTSFKQIWQKILSQKVDWCSNIENTEIYLVPNKGIIKSKSK